MACALPMNPPPIMATFITLVIVGLRCCAGQVGGRAGPSRAGEQRPGEGPAGARGDRTHPARVRVTGSRTSTFSVASVE